MIRAAQTAAMDLSIASPSPRESSSLYKYMAHGDAQRTRISSYAAAAVPPPESPRPLGAVQEGLPPPRAGEADRTPTTLDEVERQALIRGRSSPRAQAAIQQITQLIQRQSSVQLRDAELMQRENDLRQREEDMDEAAAELEMSFKADLELQATNLEATKHLKETLRGIRQEHATALSEQEAQLRREHAAALAAQELRMREVQAADVSGIARPSSNLVQ